MATVMVIGGLEVPGAPLAAGSGLSPPSNVPSLSLADVHSTQPCPVTIPNFDDPDYERWVVGRIAANLLRGYELRMNEKPKGVMRKTLISIFQSLAESELFENQRLLVWSPPRRAKKKKSVSFFADVPYKHSERTGEVFEGPVTSQLTFEKERGEDAPVFVNPEPTG